jgi:hypothetical protein
MLFVKTRSVEIYPVGGVEMTRISKMKQIDPQRKVVGSTLRE